ncbi:MAG: acetolactate synthase large subunit, partial [Alphaproteobacteria bacterium]|nr:acetolactate synthase large subunit [Alphaproteobacteria bacterium]
MSFLPKFRIAPDENVAEVSGSRLLIEALEAQGVTTIFGYPGGAIMPLYDALTSSRLTHILVRHEQGAALAADGYARVTGRAGVCLATSGPGATNLITGIGNAFMDSIPMVAITGQVMTQNMGTDAFQEVDIFGMTLPIVKHSYIIRKPEDIPYVIAEAFEIAESGRPGPVLIDFPKDVSVAKVLRPALLNRQRKLPVAAPSTGVAKAMKLIQTAKKPLLYIGGGVALAKAVPEMRRFAARTGIPAVATLKALGVLSTENPQFIGMLGMHGLRAANLAVQECDLLICCGARFDDRVTGKLDTFAPHAKVIHMDIDPAEIGKLRVADVSLPGCMKATLDMLDPSSLKIAEWKEEVTALKTKHAWKYDVPGEGIYAPLLLKQLSEQAGDKLLITCDVGQHQM